MFDVLDDDVEGFAPIPPNINTMKIERTIANTEEPISDLLSDNVVFLSIFSPHERNLTKIYSYIILHKILINNSNYLAAKLL